MKHKKQALAKSLLALLLCVAMLAGTTFAWFTDSVVSGLNTIAAGNLDVELYHSNAAVSDEKVDANTKLFLDLNGNSILWEPGVVSYENLRVTNEGDLALIYQLAINTANENYLLDNGARYGLSQALKVGVVAGGITATDRDGVVASVSSWTTLKNFLCSGSLTANADETWGVVIYWQPGDNDNNWNANNGKQLSSGDALTIDLGIKLTATQMVYESDSFGPTYDVDASGDLFPVFGDYSASVPVISDSNGNTSEAVTIAAGDIIAYIPAGVKLNAGADSLTLSITNLNTSESNVVLGENEAMRSLDVHVEGVAADNTTPITITLPKLMIAGLNMGNYQVYHVEADGTNEMTLIANDADFDAHNQFKYDPATGDITLYMASFSEVSIVAEFAKWEGNYDYSWYTPGADSYTIANGDQLAAFGAIVGGMNGQTRDPFAGKTVTLIANIDLNDVEEDGKIFYPIGYYYNGDDSAPYSTVYSFDGTFDGNGHIIKNFYQNTWEIKGDYDGTYYKDAMGLFGYVANGTIKNLTVENFESDGEFTPTGVIAAYADNSTFESIAIVNCNPRVYNTGNGGIIGIAGERGEAANQKIVLKNITVDNTNKISALWGSWDVACGGLVGMFRGNAEGGQGQIYFENCHVGAQIDVYNDVCANYQYYAYRYSGMLIGSVRCNMTGDDGHVYPNMAGISASNCTVHFGTWNDYYYCELVDNTTASYTHDYQMSRLVEVKAINDNIVTYLDGTTGTIPSSGRANYVIVDYSKGHGDENAECYHFLNGEVWTHEMGGYHDGNNGDKFIDENGDGEADLKEDKQHVYREFNNLVTGDGWGVTSKAVGDLEGVRILDREEADSVAKFESYIATLLTNKTYKLGDLFSLVNNGVDVNSQTLLVSVTNLDTNGNVKGLFTRNENNWMESTLALTGAGKVQITIQDYYFCTATTITVNVKNAVPAPGLTNPIDNGAFESSNINMWTTAVYSGEREVTPIAARSGESGLRVTGEGKNWSGLLNQTFAVESNKDYVLVFWYKVNAYGFSWTLKGVDSNTTFGSGSGHANDAEWTKVMVEFTPTNDTSVILNFSGNNDVGNVEQFFLDDIFLVEKNLIFNSGFEFGADSWKLSPNAQLVNNGTHSGNYAVQINNPSSAWVEDVVQTIPVERNQAYMITFNVKRVSGSGQYYALAAQGSSPYGNLTCLYNNPWFTCNSGSWEEKMMIVDSGDNDKMMLKFTAAETNPGTIMIDDVKVYKVNYNGILLDGDLEMGLAYEWLGISKNGNSYGLSTEEVHDGKYSMKAVGNGSWGGMAWRYFTTKAGKSYTVTAWVKVTTGSVYVGVGDYTNLWAPTTIGSKQQLNVQDTWQKVEFTFTATSNRSGFSIGGTGANGDADPNSVDTVYIDDIYVVEN